jgi:hypothetical protein
MWEIYRLQMLELVKISPHLGSLLLLEEERLSQSKSLWFDAMRLVQS